MNRRCTVASSADPIAARATHIFVSIRTRRFSYLAGVVLGVAGLLPFTASAATVFSENFSGATPGSYYGTGLISGTKFNVTVPDVDIIGTLNGSFYQCGSLTTGNCLDLVGSRGPGAVVTSTSFALAAGTTYMLTLNDLSSGAGGNDIYTATIAGFTHMFTSTTSVGSQSFSFTPLMSLENATLAFSDVTSPNAYNGPVITNINITSPTVAAVPEPSTWALMLASFGVVGALAYRRQKVRSAD